MKTALILIIAVILAGICIVKYNGLTSRDEEVIKTWKPLEAVLKERYDSIPRLIPAVVLYVGHEIPETEALKKAIPGFDDAHTIAQRAQAADSIEDTLQKFAQHIGERFPGITSNNEINLAISKIKSTDPQVDLLANSFNKAAEKFNAYRRNFPANLVAAVFGFATKYEYIQPEK